MSLYNDLGIKKALDKDNVNYNKYTIVQSLDLKSKLEQLGLKQKDVVFMLLDIDNIYSSVRVKLIKKALRHFSKNLPDDAKKWIKLSLEMVQFGMKSTLVDFGDKFYVNKEAAKGKNLTANDVVLANGGYELAFLANLVASYVFEMTENFFES
eukprot:10578067-Ditylum_brightwellii.AAC.1